LLEDIEERYGVTEADVVRVEALLDGITTLPIFVEDPVFDRFCEVDYGGQAYPEVKIIYPLGKPQSKMSLIDAFCGQPIKKPKRFSLVMPSKRKNAKKVGRKPTTKPRQRTRKTKRTQRKKKGKTMSKMAGMSLAAKAFLQCTLAPADVDTNASFVGIPDQHDGPIVAKHHVLTTPFPAYTPGKDVYVVQMPIPGLAYMWGERTAGTTGAITLNPVFYDDTASFFPSTAEDTNATAFRHASSVIEYINTNNEFTWGGALEVWKGVVKHGRTVTSTVVTGSGYLELDYLEGIGPLLNTAKPSLVLPLHDGVYVPAFNTEADFPFKDIRVIETFDLGLTANQSGASTADNFVAYGGSSAPFMRMGSFESTVIKFPSLIANQTGMLRTWACVEYQVSPLSIIWDFRRMSPAYEPAALALLKAYHKTLPVGVRFKDNATFWQSFLTWVARGAAVLKYVPGPVGLIASATGDLLGKGHGLW